jgi:hypothetical protein
MIELDVTTLVTDEDCGEFSCSMAESGRDDIGAVTWTAALAFVQEHELFASVDQDELRSWLSEWGAWDDEEIAEMSDSETRALLLQFIAGDIREMEGFDDLAEYRAAQEAGQVSGSLYQGDSGRWFFMVSA